MAGREEERVDDRPAPPGRPSAQEVIGPGPHHEGERLRKGAEPEGDRGQDASRAHVPALCGLDAESPRRDRPPGLVEPVLLDRPRVLLVAAIEVEVVEPNVQRHLGEGRGQVQPGGNVLRYAPGSHGQQTVKHGRRDKRLDVTLGDEMCQGQDVL